MNSHQRWTEKCDRCNLPAKGTGKEWIDGTRICSFCRQQLIADLEHAQEKLKEMRLLRVFPIIRKREQWQFTVQIPLETKEEINSRYGPYNVMENMQLDKLEEEQ